MNAFYSSIFRPDDQVYILDQIEAIYMESTTYFEMFIEKIDTPSYILNNMSIHFTADKLMLVSYSSSYENSVFTLTVDGKHKACVFKECSQLIF